MKKVISFIHIVHGGKFCYGKHVDDYSMAASLSNEEATTKAPIK